MTPRSCLSGTHILVAAQRRADLLAASLSDRGAEVDVLTVLDLRPLSDRHLESVVRSLSARKPSVVAVTSVSALGALSDYCRSAHGDTAALAEALSGSVIVVRGPKVQQAAVELGLFVDPIAVCETSEEMGNFIGSQAGRQDEVAVLRGQNLPSHWENRLAISGRRLSAYPCYSSRPAHMMPQHPAWQRLRDGGYDAIVTTSAGGAHELVEAAAAEDALTALRLAARGPMLVAAVGSIAARPWAYAGVPVQVPTAPRIGALLRLVIHELGDDERALRTQAGLLRMRACGVTLDHRAVDVSEPGLAVLRRLAQTPGCVVSRAELLAVLPGDSRDPHAAEVAVARLRSALRAALGDTGLVRTVVRRGYLLSAH